MGATLCGSVWPSIVYKSHDGEPSVPIVLPGQGVEVEVLLHPLILVLGESVSLRVECGADVSPYAQLHGQCSCLCEVKQGSLSEMTLEGTLNQGKRCLR